MSLKKVAGINLAILLIYTLIANATATGHERGLQVMVLLAMLIAVHTGIVFLISIIHFASKNKVAGRNFLLSALIVLVIGFSVCFGSASL
jgi:hypothetical protein